MTNSNLCQRVLRQLFLVMVATILIPRRLNTSPRASIFLHYSRSSPVHTFSDQPWKVTTLRTEHLSFTIDRILNQLETFPVSQFHQFWSVYVWEARRREEEEVAGGGGWGFANAEGVSMDNVKFKNIALFLSDFAADTRIGFIGICIRGYGGM